MNLMKKRLGNNMALLKQLFCVFVFGWTVFGHSTAWSQLFTAASRTEVGVMLGGSHYFGDLNQGKNRLRFTHLAGQVFVRYNVHSRLAIRANVGIGMVSGADSLSSNPVLVNRNLSFRSMIVEGAAGVEFHYLKYQLGHRKYNFTHYILAQVGVFYMDPKAKYNDDWYKLRDIGTEGQGSALSSKRRYSPIQISFPIGMGIKFSPTERFSIGLEYGIRLTFTDYIDDVGSGTYIARGKMIEEKGPTAAALSNRSLDQNDLGYRGNSNTNDWYSFFGVTMTFQIGKHKACVQP